MQGLYHSATLPSPCIECPLYPAPGLWLMNYHNSTWKFTSTSILKLHQHHMPNYTEKLNSQFNSFLLGVIKLGEGLLPEDTGWWEIIQNALLPPAGQLLYYTSVSVVVRTSLGLRGCLLLLHAVHERLYLSSCTSFD